MTALFRIRSHPDLSCYRPSSLERHPNFRAAHTKFCAQGSPNQNKKLKTVPILKVSTMRLRGSKPKLSTLEKYSWNPENRTRNPLLPTQPSITSLESPNEKEYITRPKRLLRRKKQVDFKEKTNNISINSRPSTENPVLFNQSEIKSKEDVLKTFSSTPSLRPIQFFKQLVLPFQSKKRQLENNQSVGIEFLLDELQRRQ